MAYADRSLVLEDAHRDLATSPALLGNIVVVNGIVLGTWNRILAGTTVRIALRLFRTLASDEVVAVKAAAERYGRFLGMRADVSTDVRGRTVSAEPANAPTRRRPASSDP